MSEFTVLCLALGAVYWLLCALVVHKVSAPVGVNGDGTKVRRDEGDWFMIITAPIWVTVFAIIASVQMLVRKARQ